MPPGRLPRQSPGTGLTLPLPVYGLVGQDDDACPEGLRPDQAQRRLGAVPEQQSAMSRQDRVHREPELVGQAAVEQRLCETTVAEDGDVTAVLLLEPGHLGRDVAPDDRRVVPVGLSSVEEKTYLRMLLTRSANWPVIAGQIAAK